ncbi:MAG: hypothetical protein AAFR96_02060 [Planctomycetota bacterium]
MVIWQKLSRSNRIATAAAAALLACTAPATAQHRLPPVEATDVDRAEAILAKADAAIAGAAGYRYRATASYVSHPPTAAIASHAASWEFVGGGGRFRSLAPTNLTLCDGERVYSIQLDTSVFESDDVPDPSEIEEAIADLGWGYGQAWLTDASLDPSVGVHTQVDRPDFEILGTLREEIEGEPGEWVYMTWHDDDQGRNAFVRAWHDDDRGLPVIWEYDNSEWYDFETIRRHTGVEVERVVYRVHAAEFDLLDDAPAPELFVFDDEGLEPFDDDADFDFGFDDDADEPMPEFLGLNPEAVTLGTRYGSMQGMHDLREIDIDGDGDDDIVGWSGGPRVVVFDPNGGRARTIRFRGIAEDSWTINSFTPVEIGGGVCFALEMERYDTDDWSLAEVVLSLFDAEGNEVWSTLSDENVQGATNYTYLTAADVTGDGRPEIVLGRHYMSSSDWSDGQGMIEVYNAEGGMLTRSQVGESIDGVETIETDRGPIVIAIVDGSARAIDFDGAKITDFSGPPPREKREPQPENAREDDNAAPIF